jgi:methyl-accepting chemotaxis protein
MAGPVYRFKKDLAEVSAGNLDITIRLRDKDDLKDLAEDLNLMIKELRGFVNTLQGSDTVMSSCINELEDQIKNNKISSETGKELIDTIQANKADIAQVLEKYTKR